MALRPQGSSETPEIWVMPWFRWPKNDTYWTLRMTEGAGVDLIYDVRPKGIEQTKGKND